MPDIARVTLSSSAGLAIAACTLPSAKLPVSSPPDPVSAPPPATFVETPAARKSSIRSRPPVIVAAELGSEGKSLRLSFSEPLAAPTGVEPNDFRISMAMLYAYARYAYVYYYDPVSMSDDADAELLNITAIRHHDDVLELLLEPAIAPGYCHEMQAAIADTREPGIRVDGGLFLHYAPGATAITDTDGQALKAIAAQWVLHRHADDDDAYEMYFEGPRARRALREAIPIGCGPLDTAGP